MSCLLIAYVAVDTDSTTAKAFSAPDVREKRMKAIKYVKEKYKLGEHEIVFRLVALRHPTGGDRAGFPENVVVSSRADMQRHLGPTLIRLLDTVEAQFKYT
jgi:hypothetical protein